MENSRREKEIYRTTLAGSIVNLLLLIFKFVAGILGHSAAMIADAVHSLSDFATDIVVIVFVRISAKPADRDHDYGHGKYETLATAIIGIALLCVGAGILAGGVMDIIAVLNGKELPPPGIVALIAAALSIVVKEIIYRYTVRKGKELGSQAVVANAWHHRSDAFSSIGTFIGIGGALIGGTRWHVLDPIAAIIVSLFIIKVAADILKGSLQELLEHSLPEEVENEINAIILSVEGVTTPHNLRTRRIGSRLAIEAHIRMDGDITLRKAHETTTIVERLLKEKFGQSTHVTIHTEPVKK